MTSEELYFELHLLVNKNNNQQNINIEKSHFVQLFNREQEKWLYDIINNKNNDDSINDIQSLVVSDFELEISEIKNNHNIYYLPSDFFNYIECKVKAISSEKVKNIYCNFIHPKEINVFITDEFNKPSFEWEETLSYISNNKLYVFKNDFDLENCFLTYYKNVQCIELEGYIKLNGMVSKNINSNLNDIYKRQILDRVAKEINREFENVQGFQFSQERKEN